MRKALLFFFKLFLLCVTLHFIILILDESLANNLEGFVIYPKYKSKKMLKENVKNMISYLPKSLRKRANKVKKKYM